MTDPIDNDVSAYVSGYISDEMDEALWGSQAAFADRLHTVLEHITYKADYEITHGADHRGFWIEITHFRPDANTGEWGTGHGGKRYLNPEMTGSDIIRAVFGACVAYEEHEVREFLLYAGQRIFDPHMNLHALALWLKERRDG